MKLDLDYISERHLVLINDEPYTGKIAVGDTLTVNGLNYAVLGITYDKIVVKELT